MLHNVGPTEQLESKDDMDPEENDFGQSPFRAHETEKPLKIPNFQQASYSSLFMQAPQTPTNDPEKQASWSHQYAY